MLAPGDVVFVPDKTTGEQCVAAGQRHRFVVRGATVALKLTLRDRRGTALANKPFEVTAGSATRTGSTDGNGRLEVRVPVTAQNGTLTIGDVTFPIAIGHLDPVEEATGLRQRLRNLGLLPHASPSDDLVSETLRKFQRANGLPETGLADDVTRDKLREKHRV